MTPNLIDRLRRIAARLCTTAAMEQRIEPTLADLRNESLEAHGRGQRWHARRLEIAGAIAVAKVILLITLERGADSLLRPDAETRSTLLRLAAIFGLVVTVVTFGLVWAPLNLAPVPRPVDARGVLYLIPQALPLAVPIGLTIAIVLGVKASLSARLTAWILVAALTCSSVSFLTLGWWAPASNQAFRTAIFGREIGKGERELTLGELASRIDQIRAFDPAAPAIRLSVVYYTRWSLSMTPLVLTMFALAMAGRYRGVTAGRALGAAVSSAGFTVLLMWTNYLAFRGRVSPSLGAWLPNLLFLGLTMALMLASKRHHAQSASLSQ